MKKRKLPEFKNERAEAQFWQTHDSSDHVDWSKARRVRLHNLKPSTETISLRLPADLLNAIKIKANKQDIPYQSLVKVLLAEKLEQ